MNKIPDQLLENNHFRSQSARGACLFLFTLRDELIAQENESPSIVMHSPKILTLDLEKLETIKSKSEEAVSLFGRVDILINNAGMTVRCVYDFI